MADFGITEAYKTPLTSEQLAPREALGLTTSPFGVRIKRTNINIPGLLSSAVKALMLEIAYLETSNDNTYNQNNRYGKYAVHKNTLINYGYLSADGRYWQGLEGISSVSSFLASTRLQDRIMERFLVEQYATGINVGSIKDNDSIATVASMLAVAYQFQDYTYESNTLAANISIEIDSINYFQLNNTVRTTTVTAHGLNKDESFVIITNSNIELNGTFTVSDLINSTTIEYLHETTANANLSFTSDGGTISNPLPVNKIDSSYLVSTAANLSTNLANTLSTLGYANVAKSHYDNSGLSTLASDFTQSLSFSSVNNEIQKRLYAIVQDINDTSLVTTQTVESALYGNIEGRNKQLAVSSAQASITTLNNKINNTYQNLPALRAKQWRATGDINDSRGRPGALFFNAGKYAIDVLDADVITG